MTGEGKERTEKVLSDPGNRRNKFETRLAIKKQGRYERELNREKRLAFDRGRSLPGNRWGMKRGETGGECLEEFGLCRDIKY